MAHQETTPLPSSQAMNRLWRERELERERERERAHSKQRFDRHEATLKRVSAAMERASSDQRAVSATSRMTNNTNNNQQPRTAMAKLFSAREHNVRTPSMLERYDTEYSRRSEPSLAPKSDVVTMDKQQEMEATELRFRRSLPAVGSRSPQDLAYALQSVIMSDTSSSHNGSYTSSSGSSSSGSSVAIITRSSAPPLSTVNELHASRSTGDVSRQLERARSAEVTALKADPVDEATRLRQQVTLLLRTLEEEKKRRTVEQKLMQQKILELQGLIRHNMPEQKRELERSLQSPVVLGSSRAPSVTTVTPTPTPAASAATSAVRGLRTNKEIQQAQERSPYKTMKLLSEMGPEQNGAVGGTDDEQDDDGDDIDDGEDDSTDNEGDNNNKTGRRNGDSQARQQSQTDSTTKAEMKLQLTKLRARMRSLVQEAQQEAQTLKKCLDDERRAHERKERQLRMESSLRVTSLEERYAYAKKKLVAKTSLLKAEVTMLSEEKEKLLEELQRKDMRIQQLELAVGGRRIVEASTRNSQS